jgi:hypothetical protein
MTRTLSERQRLANAPRVPIRRGHYQKSEMAAEVAAISKVHIWGRQEIYA